LGTLSADDILDLWQDLAGAVRRGQSVAVALREFAVEAPGKASALAARLADKVEGGAALSEAVAAEGPRLGPGAAAALRAGERGGDVGTALEALARGVGEAEGLRRLIGWAIAYPLLIGLAATAFVVFLNTSIIPQFERMFGEFSMTLPALTQHIGAVAMAFSLLILVSAATLGLLYVANWRPWPLGARVDSARLWFPLLGRLARRQMLAQWCGAMETLVTSGAPEPEAVRLAGQATGNLEAQAACEMVARSVESGATLGQGMESSRAFPDALCWMVQAAEASGGHGRVWAVARELYGEEARRSLPAVSAFVSAWFIVLGFGMVVLCALAIHLPLMRLLSVLGS